MSRYLSPWRWLDQFTTRRPHGRHGDRLSRRSLTFESLSQRRLLSADSAAHADLVYDPTTGDLSIDTTGVESGYVMGYSLRSNGGFREENAVKPFVGFLFARDNEIVLLSLEHNSGIFHVGHVAPMGLTLAELDEFLVAAEYAGGTPVALPFNLVLAGHVEARPSAAADAATATESTPIVIDVLANDTSPNDESLTVAGASLATGQGEIFVRDNQLFYDPRGSFDHLAAGEQYLVEIVYLVSNGLATDTATVVVTVTGENDLPLAGDDTVRVDATDASTDVTHQLLGNDSDPDNDPLVKVVGLDTTGTRGVVTRSGDRVSYDPAGRFGDLSPGETATDTFQYQVMDRDGAVATATVTVTVRGVRGGADGSSTIVFPSPVDPEWGMRHPVVDPMEYPFVVIAMPTIPITYIPITDVLIASPSEGLVLPLSSDGSTDPQIDAITSPSDGEDHEKHLDAVFEGVTDFRNVEITLESNVVAVPAELWEDAARVRRNFGRKDATHADGDLDRDGVVQFSDFIIAADQLLS